ncbi:hypothetical protein H5410_008880 [Solanum commersonii]|uniref:Uncharacterized protein n=1 Tax=Solanum commersonii TaxID=4109 RepID=A0A9J6AG78_SOLCO|nr:hypothetical protein H5410_008880 [Solanum commersonii]
MFLCNGNHHSLKWWSFEVLTLLSELLPNPKLETSELSIWYVCLHQFMINCFMLNSWFVCSTDPHNLFDQLNDFFIALCYTIWIGSWCEYSTRVSNELGSGNPQKALVAVRVAMFLAVVETVVVSTVTILCCGILGKAYSNDEQVVDYVAAIAPFLCLSIITDSLQAVISGKSSNQLLYLSMILKITGIDRGSRWLIIGAYVNLGAFYLVGIPVASLLCFVVNLKAKGLWIGLLVGSAIQATSFSLILVFTDWQKQVHFDLFLLILVFIFCCIVSLIVMELLQAIKAKKRISERR